MREATARIGAIVLRGAVSWLLLWTLVFGLLRILSPDPVTIIAGIYSDNATRERLGAEYGVGHAIWPMYVKMLSRMLTLDFGVSWRNHEPVKNVLREPFLLSLAISGASALIACMGAAVAFLLVAWRGRRTSGLVRVAATAVAALPGFLVALVLSRSGLPAWLSIPAYGLVPGLAGRLRSIILPSVCVIIPVVPYSILRLLSCYEAIVSAPWFRTARAFGGSYTAVTLRYGWSFAIAALADVAANATVLSFTGSVAVEYVFGIPGVGTAMIDAIQLRDTPTILAIVSGVSLLTIVLLVIRDISQVALRVRQD